MSGVDVLAAIDRQLRDRAERANRYRKNAEKHARKHGEPQITADRMAAYSDLLLSETREIRAAVAELVEADTQLVKELHDILGDNDDVQPPETARAQVDAMRDVLRDYEMRAALAAVTLSGGVE